MSYKKAYQNAQSLVNMIQEDVANIDTDIKSIKNTSENIKINNCKKINLIKGDINQLNTTSLSFHQGFP